jgi:2-dehydropantoate 2-reductase
MSATSSPLRIAVLGVGKIGSAFAFQLARTGGHDVTAIARPESLRLKQLERDQAIVDVAGERAGVRVASSLDEETAYDLVIVTLLAHQTDPLLPALRRSSARCIQFMFNTFHPERLQEAIGVERCAFGMPFVQATLDGDGKLKVAIGAGGQKSIMSRQSWVDVFKAAGLPAALEPDMPLWLRCHAPFCVAFESVSAAGERRGGGASWGEALVLARGVHASFALIKSLGYDIYPSAKERIGGSPIWVMAAILWFVSRIRSFRELLATGAAEAAALVDAMVSAAPPGMAPVVVSDIEAMKPL